MPIIYTIAGITVIIFAVAFIIKGLVVAGQVTAGTARPIDAAIWIVGGLLLGLSTIVFYLQILAVVNGGDAWLFTWVSGIWKSVFSGGLPMLK